METFSGTTIPFPYQIHLTSMCVEYKNPDGSLIADKVLPYVPVDSKIYLYNVYPDSTNFSVPKDIEVGRIGETPEISWEAKQKPGELKVNGLQTPVPRIDKITPAAFDVTSMLVDRLNNCHDLHREYETVNLVSDPALYPATNQMTLTGASKWTDPSSDPIALFEDLIENALVPYNKFICGSDVWLAISRHPKVVKTILGDANTKGRVEKEEFCKVLELDEVIVGKGRIDLSEPGVPPNIVRCWKGRALLLHTRPLVTTTQDFAFGITAEFKDKRELLHYFDPEKGPLGSDVYRVVHPRNQHIMAPRLGFLFTGAV